MGAGCDQQQSPIVDPRLATEARAQVRVALDREIVGFERARHLHSIGVEAEILETGGVGLVLSAKETESVQNPRENPQDATIASGRSLGHLRVDDRDRNPAATGEGDLIRPKLELDQDQQARPQAAKGTSLDPGEVEGAVEDLEVGIGLSSQLEAGSGGRRNNEDELGMSRTKLLDEAAGRQHLANGDPVDPDAPLSFGEQRKAAQPSGDGRDGLPLQLAREQVDRPRVTAPIR